MKNQFTIAIIIILVAIFVFCGAFIIYVAQTTKIKTGPEIQKNNRDKITKQIPVVSPAQTQSNPQKQISNASENIYILDAGNKRVQKFDSNGHFISQLGCDSGACSIGAGNNEFDTPDSIAIDSKNNIYVADIGNNRVQKFDSNGKFIFQIGCASGKCSSGSESGQFGGVAVAQPFGMAVGPVSLAVDLDDNVYVADKGNNRIQKFDENGKYISQIGCVSGKCSAGYNINGQFDGLNEIAIGPSNEIYVSEDGNNRVQKLDPNGGFVLQLGCASGACPLANTGAGQFREPGSVAVAPNGDVYVGDLGNGRIEKFDSNGNYLNQIGCASAICPSKDTGNGNIQPAGIAIDSSGIVYVVDISNNRVQKFDSNGNYISQIGCTSGVCPHGTRGGQFGLINAIAVH